MIFGIACYGCASNPPTAFCRITNLDERFLDSYRFDDAAPGSVASPLAGEAAA
jgi:hypothetical protein